MPLMTEKKWSSLKPGDVIIPSLIGSPTKNFTITKVNEGKIFISWQDRKKNEKVERGFTWDQLKRSPVNEEGVSAIFLTHFKEIKSC